MYAHNHLPIHKEYAMVLYPNNTCFLSTSTTFIAKMALWKETKNTKDTHDGESGVFLSHQAW